MRLPISPQYHYFKEHFLWFKRDSNPQIHALPDIIPRMTPSPTFHLTTYAFSTKLQATIEPYQITYVQ